MHLSAALLSSSVMGKEFGALCLACSCCAVDNRQLPRAVAFLLMSHDSGGPQQSTGRIPQRNTEEATKGGSPWEWRFVLCGAEGGVARAASPASFPPWASLFSAAFPVLPFSWHMRHGACFFHISNLKL